LDPKLQLIAAPADGRAETLAKHGTAVKNQTSSTTDKMSRGPRRWRPRSSTALATVVLVTTVALLGILGWTLVTVDGITQGFQDTQLRVDGTANAHRELLRLQADVVHLHLGGNVSTVDLHRGLLLRQFETLEGVLGPDRRRDAVAVEQELRRIDWNRLQSLPAVGPGRHDIIESTEQQLQVVERHFKEFYDRQVKGFYRTTGEALAAKSSSQRLLLVLAALTVVLALSWVVSMRRQSRSDLAEAYDALRISEERFRSFVQNSSDLTLVCDADGVLVYVSPASQGILGLIDTELTGRSLDELVHPDDAKTVRNRWNLDDHGEDTQRLGCRLRHADGSFRAVEATFTNLLACPTVRGVVLNLRDVTDRHRLETELRHAQKLESVGQLAAGIAHEINTPIQFVGDNVRFLQDAFADLDRVIVAYRQAGESAEPADGLAEASRLEGEIDIGFLAGEIPQAIDQTLEGVERVATIVRAMKAFGHPTGDDKAPADLNESVRNTLVVAGNAVRYVANVVTDLGELSPVWCHLGDINQVVLNLVVNAAHAVAAAVGDSGQLGTITVRTRQEGDEVVVEVADTGVGIAPEIAHRIFEPFFTTKDVGAGTGQGLALVYSLVTERHGGAIGFESESGAGTTFTVRLPVGPASQSAANEAAA
jgi:PAS domain S-box-containing protein